MCAFTACQSAVFACMICCLLCSRIDKLATVLMPCAAEQRGLMQNWLLSQRVDLAARRCIDVLVYKMADSFTTVFGFYAASREEFIS